MIIFFYIGIAILAVANIGGIGYGLFLWGGTGMAFGAAAWMAFKFWIMWISVGIVSLFSGLIFGTK